MAANGVPPAEILSVSWHRPHQRLGRRILAALVPQAPPSSEQVLLDGGKLLSSAALIRPFPTGQTLGRDRPPLLLWAVDIVHWPPVLLTDTVALPSSPFLPIAGTGNRILSQW